MKKQIVKAYNGQGEHKTFAGEREVDLPETWIDILEIEADDEAAAVARWNRSFVIDVQREIRAGTQDSMKMKVRKLEKAAKDDPELAAKLATLGFKL